MGGSSHSFDRALVSRLERRLSNYERRRRHSREMVCEREYSRGLSSSEGSSMGILDTVKAYDSDVSAEALKVIEIFADRVEGNKDDSVLVMIAMAEHYKQIMQKSKASVESAYERGKADGEVSAMKSSEDYNRGFRKGYDKACADMLAGDESSGDSSEGSGLWHKYMEVSEKDIDVVHNERSWTWPEGFSKREYQYLVSHLSELTQEMGEIIQQDGIWADVLRDAIKGMLSKAHESGELE